MARHAGGYHSAGPGTFRSDNQYKHTQSSYYHHPGWATSMNRFDGECMIEFRANRLGIQLYFGLSETLTTGNTQTEHDYLVYLGNNNSILVKEHGTDVTGYFEPYDVDTRFRVRRFFDDIAVDPTEHKWVYTLSKVEIVDGSDNEVEIHRSSDGLATGNPVYAVDMVYFIYGGLGQVKYDMELSPNEHYIGHFDNATGIHSPKFTGISKEPEDMLCKIDGVDAIVEVFGSHQDVALEPLETGNVRIYYHMGIIEFSPDDVGKALEFHTDVIYYPG